LNIAVNRIFVKLPTTYKEAKGKFLTLIYILPKSKIAARHKHQH
jgi:hypothetical protein